MLIKYEEVALVCRNYYMNIVNTHNGLAVLQKLHIKPIQISEDEHKYILFVQQIINRVNCYVDPYSKLKPAHMIGVADELLKNLAISWVFTFDEEYMQMHKADDFKEVTATFKEALKKAVFKQLTPENK